MGRLTWATAFTVIGLAATAHSQTPSGLTQPPLIGQPPGTGVPPGTLKPSSISTPAAVDPALVIPPPPPPVLAATGPATPATRSR